VIVEYADRMDVGRAGMAEMLYPLAPAIVAAGMMRPVHGSTNFR